LFCPLLTVKDKLLTLRLKLELMRFSLLEVFDNPQFAKQTTLEALDQRGFSKNFINHFVKPFFGGVFGEDSLKTGFFNFAFCYKVFSEAAVFLPSSGVGSFIEALAHKLPRSSIKTSKGVAKIQNNDGSVSLFFEDGSTENFEAVILALEPESLFNLLNLDKVEINRTVFTNLYFLSDVSLNTAKKIFLNSDNNRLISFGAEISSVCNDLLPKGESRHLISVTILLELESESLVKTAQEELENLFSHTKNHLQYLKSFSIRGAASLFNQDPENKRKLANLHKEVQKVIPQKVFLAGEFGLEACSQEHAILSGKKAALEYLSSI
jgi:protoporphyrinogen oxidase